MKPQKEYILLLQRHSAELREEFGVSSLRIFGSVARGEQNEGSDVDICVEMQPRIFLLIALKEKLEHLLGCPVDLIRKHRNMNPLLEEEINRNSLYVF